jgi:cell division protein FtsB
MTQSGARTTPVRTGATGASGEKRTPRSARRGSATAARRRWLILFAMVVIVVAAIAANIGPLTHYHEAKSRLDAATAKVNALKAQRADMQEQVAKLSETGYLETLARGQLTYVRPGEDLYIVTPSADGTEEVTVTPAARVRTASGLGLAAVGNLQAGVVREETPEAPASSAGDGTDTASPEDSPESPDSAGSPGFLERTLNAIRDIF